MNDITDNPKLMDLVSSNGNHGSDQEKTSTQKISVSDHINGFQYTTDNKSDSFVIDMETFSHGGNNKDINPNSRITLQRSLSRKGSQRGEKKIITPNSNNSNSSSSSTLNDRDSFIATSSSPRGPSTPEKPTAVAVGSSDHASNQQVHHQISITTGNITSATENKISLLRRNSCRRSTPPWRLDPKRILMFFATLSSMGTILLIYFTLSISKMKGDENAFD